MPYMMIMTSIRVCKKKKKKKKIFRPTYPNFLGHVTGNTHTFLFGLTKASVVSGYTATIVGGMYHICLASKDEYSNGVFSMDIGSGTLTFFVGHSLKILVIVWNFNRPIRLESSLRISHDVCKTLMPPFPNI